MSGVIYVLGWFTLLCFGVVAAVVLVGWVAHRPAEATEAELDGDGGAVLSDGAVDVLVSEIEAYLEDVG